MCLLLERVVHLTAFTSALSIPFSTPQSIPTWFNQPAHFHPICSIKFLVPSWWANLTYVYATLYWSSLKTLIRLTPLPPQDLLPLWPQNHPLSFDPHVPVGSFANSFTVPLPPPAVPFPGIPAQMSSHSRSSPWERSDNSIHLNTTYKLVTENPYIWSRSLALLSLSPLFLSLPLSLLCFISPTSSGNSPSIFSNLTLILPSNTHKSFLLL